MFKLKELKAKIILIHILTIFLVLFVLMSIFLNYHPELIKIIESGQFTDKKLEKYAKNIIVLQLFPFFLSALIISFIRKKQDYSNSIVAIIIFLLPFFIISFNIMNITVYILSILILALITALGTWFGYHLRPVKLK